MIGDFLSVNHKNRVQSGFFLSADFAMIPESARPLRRSRFGAESVGIDAEESPQCFAHWLGELLRRPPVEVLLDIGVIFADSLRDGRHIYVVLFHQLAQILGGRVSVHARTLPNSATISEYGFPGNIPLDALGFPLLSSYPWKTDPILSSAKLKRSCRRPE